MSITKRVKPISKRKERIERATNFVENNKVFTFIAVVVVLFLLGNFIFSKVNQSEQTPSVDVVEETIAENETVTKAEVPQKNEWRFYFIDLWILGIGGGVCFIMILRERKKSKSDID